MLGRLFKNQAQQPMSNTHNPPNTPIATVLPQSNTFEDSYTREILYATSAPFKPFQLSPKAFRIMVSQDAGNLRQKQVLFDSALDNNKRHRFHSDLNDFMFGAGLPSNEINDQIKVHLLHNSVLITRLFSIKRDDDDDRNESTLDAEDDDWNPVATIRGEIRKRRGSNERKDHRDKSSNPLSINIERSDRESRNTNSSPCDHNNHHSLSSKAFFDEESTNSDDSCAKCKPSKLKSVHLMGLSPVNSFAIGIVIPVDSTSDIYEVVINNWEEFSLFIYGFQKTVSKRLLEHLSAHSGQYITNRRIQFPNFILQNDSDLHNYVIKLAKLAHYGANIPRLAPTKALLLNKENRSTLINWVLEVMNWMEFKDGKSGFLASLLAILRIHQKSLQKKTYDTEPLTTKDRETTRVVIMTGNPVVAKKLVFIISAIVGYDLDQVVDVVQRKLSGLSLPSSPISDINISPENLASSLCSSPTNDLSVSPSSRSDHYTNDLPRSLGGQYKSDFRPVEYKSDEKHDFSNSLNMFSSSPKSIVNSHRAPPRPGFHESPSRMKKASSFSSSFSSDHSLPSIRGWEVPGKSAASTMGVLDGPILDAGKSTPQTTVKGIPIARPVTSTTTGNMSLSKSSSMNYLSSSLSSSSKFGSSFFDKWKSSFGSTMDDYGEESSSLTLSKRNSVKSFRTPSPAIEADDFYWGSSLMDDVTNRDSYRWVETNKWADNSNRLSRTQSMFDFCDKKPTSQQIRRTKTSVGVPIGVQREASADMNNEIIQKKCEGIFTGDVSWIGADDNSMEVSLPESDTPILHNQPLLPNVAFSDEFRPEYGLQSCPINPKLESSVMCAMKNDLSFYQNRYSSVLIRTIFVSLRAREIKFIEMKLDGDYGQYKTKIKKVFSGGRNLGNHEEIAKVEKDLSEIHRLFADQQVRKADAEEFERRMRGVVNNIICV